MDRQHRTVHAISPSIRISALPAGVCPVCFGKGSVLITVKPQPFYADHRLKWEVAVCRDCDGTGRAQ